MKIIHCGDIHLDSGMEHNLTPAKARERNAEICGTFVRMVQYAREQDVAAILIAGDLFDTGHVSARTADFVENQIRRAENIQFYYLRGNHDQRNVMFAGQDLPGNFHTFGEGWTSHRLGNVVITGLEMTRDNCCNMYEDLKLDASDTNIVTLHGMESARPGEEEIAIPMLRNRNIHYLALGHIHSHKLAKLDEFGQYGYCGSPEGRGFDECGEKGFVLLDIRGQNVQAEFVPIAERRLHEISVDITGLTTVTRILTAMETAAAEIPASDLVKFVLTGGYTPETQKDLGFLTKMLESRFYCVKVQDQSRLKLLPGSYEHDISLKGEFIRLVLASDKTEEEKEVEEEPLEMRTS